MRDGRGAQWRLRRRVWRGALAIGAVAIPIGLGTLGALVVAARAARGDPATLDRVRAFNRQRLNPRMMRLAGRPGFYAHVLWHRGRRSGRLYATPVEAFPIGGGYVIPLTYGLRCDWARNALAAGEAMLERDGVRQRLGDPRVVALAELGVSLPLAPRLALRLLGVRKALSLRADCAAPNGLTSMHEMGDASAQNLDRTAQ